MQVIPRISGERLASLPAGARLSFNNQIITLNHCRGGWVNYTDAGGCCREHEVAVVVASATEQLDATQCQVCGNLRLRSDLLKKRFQTAGKPEDLLVCIDGQCIHRYQLSRNIPARRMHQPKPKGRTFKRSGYVSY
jgi:hypothetical protein